jgi:midasin
MVILDGLASLPQTQGWSRASLSELHKHAIKKILDFAPNCLDTFELRFIFTPISAGIGPFQLPFGPLPSTKVNFAVNAPTTLRNALRVFRACQLDKPILLEGSPGVGKTSLIAALSAMLGYKFCRVNLSDQTDLMDLFGSDLPVEGGSPGEFAWRDAAFLRALQEGEWVLLDEMNLAPQSVLEGLNAVLDHRGSVYVPELGRSFHRHPNFRVFAAQNPFQQGGGRKGLPKSFLNRFTKVYMEELTSEDYLIIAGTLFPQWPQSSLRDMIKFNQHLHEETSLRQLWGREGSPWEFNLRDIMRWLALYEGPSHLELQPGNPLEFLEDIYLQRFRSPSDCTSLSHISAKVFGSSRASNQNPHLSLSSSFVQFGHALLRRAPTWRQPPYQISPLHPRISAAQSIQKCIENGWLVILTGGSATGKTSILRHFASFHGIHLVEFHANSATDTSDLLGGFEQVSHAGSENIPLSLLKQAVDDLAGNAPFTTPDIHEVLRWQGHDLQKVNSLARLLPEGSQKDQLLEAIRNYRFGDSKARFEWVDGPLVQALRSGSWFVLNNANLCSPSVLDRLNSLCEMGGTLSLTERGLVNDQVEVLRPHPGFRLFMCMDPAYGELSRAMRNRGVEIHLQRPGDLSSLRALSSQSSADTPISQQYLTHLTDKYFLSPLQILLKLSDRILALPETLRLRFVVHYLPLRCYNLLYRLPPFEMLGRVVKTFASTSPTINFVNLIEGSCSIPSGFLEAQVCPKMKTYTCSDRLPERQSNAQSQFLWKSLLSKFVLPNRTISA